MTTPSPLLIDKLVLIHLADQQLLMARNHNQTAWFNPGGKREPGETDQQALIREVKEELAVDIIPDTIRPYGVFEAPAHNKPAGTIVRLTCYTADFTGELTASAEVAEIRFMTYTEAADTTEAGQLVFEDLHAKGLLR